MKEEKVDYRIRITKLLIRKTFMEMLSKQPIQQITVKQLCERAGINRGTFYSHYNDIYDLLHQIEYEMKKEFEQVLSQVFTTCKEDPVKMISRIFACLQDNYDLCMVTLGEYGDKKFMVELLALGKKQYMEMAMHYFPKATQSQMEYFFAFVSNGCIGLIQKWLQDGMMIPIEQVSEMGEKIMRSGMEFLKEDNVKKGSKHESRVF